MSWSYQLPANGQNGLRSISGCLNEGWHVFIYKSWHSFGGKDFGTDLPLINYVILGTLHLLPEPWFCQTMFSRYFHIKRTVDNSLNLSLTVDWMIRIITKDVEQMTFISLIIFIVNIIIVAGPWNTRTFHWVIAYYNMVLMGTRTRAFPFIGHRGDVSLLFPCIAILKDMGQCYYYNKSKLCTLWSDPRLKIQTAEF